MNKPLVTVLMPVYNGEKYVREAIDSMLNQTFGDFEFLIINDGSTDSTEEIILSYADARIHYVKNDRNSGLVYTLNRGLDMVQTPYVARMDADDISVPERLEQQILCMEQHPEVGVLGSWVETIGLAKNREIQYKDDPDHIRFKLLFNSCVIHPTVVMRMSVLNENHLRYPAMEHVEDFALWVLLSRYTKFKILPKVLLQYRIHENGVSQKYSDLQHKQAILLRKQQLLSFDIVCDEKSFDIYTKFIDHHQVDNSDDFKILLSFLEQILSKTKTQGFYSYLYSYFEREVHQFVEHHACDMKSIVKHFSHSIFAFSHKQLIRLTFKSIFSIK